MLNPRQLMRMKRWAQNPPSLKRVLLVFGVVAACLLIVGLDWMGWWPEWAKTEKVRLR